MTRPSKRMITAALLLAFAGGMAAIFWPRPQPLAASQAAPVTPIGVGALGRVEPASRVRKLSQPGGFSVNRVDRVLVTEGDRVAQGQVVAELGDTAQKDAAVAQARAALAEARANQQRILAAGRATEIAAQRARIESLAAQEAISRRDAERAESLMSSGAGARATAERDRAAAARAAADRREAEAQLETLSNPRAEDVAVATAQVASAEASLLRAQADATLSRVTAPIAGTVLKIYARPGDLIGTDGLMDIADLDHLDVVADIYETDLPRIRRGATAEVIVPGDSKRYSASVQELGWLVRRTTQASADPVAAVDARTVEVRLRLDDAGRQALRQRINMQVQVAIPP